MNYQKISEHLIKHMEEDAGEYKRFKNHIDIEIESAIVDKRYTVESKDPFTVKLAVMGNKRYFNEAFMERYIKEIEEEKYCIINHYHTVNEGNELLTVEMVIVFNPVMFCKPRPDIRDIHNKQIIPSFPTNL